MDFSFIGEKLIVPLLVAIVGSLFTNLYLARQLKRKELAIKLIEQFLAKDSERSQAIGILTSPPHLNNAPDRNAVQALGNWFEAVAILSHEGEVDARLIRKVQMDTEAIALRDDIKAALERDDQETCPENKLNEEARFDLQQMLKAWPHFEWFLRKTQRKGYGRRY